MPFEGRKREMSYKVRKITCGNKFSLTRVFDRDISIFVYSCIPTIKCSKSRRLINLSPLLICLHSPHVNSHRHGTFGSEDQFCGVQSIQKCILPLATQFCLPVKNSSGLQGNCWRSYWISMRDFFVCVCVKYAKLTAGNWNVNFSKIRMIDISSRYHQTF